ncbi:MAG: beta-lactamase family protein, partial [Acidobacteria bacterium]|nr:beta-lactamase family protein [Acidobacteriota bacterium]
MSQRIDSVMREYDGDVPGASVLVMRGGHPLSERSWGLAALAQQVPATPATPDRLASGTKHVT